jgi:hypothetical protein
MHALKDLFTSDVGLMSVAGIAFMAGDNYLERSATTIVSG